jgi:hypothetical protein
VFGAVDGDGVVFGAVFANAAQARFGGIVVESDLAIEGSYGVSDGQCAGDGGTWCAVKIVEPGDANDDGTINDRDARDLFRLPLGGRPALSGHADCNKDGLVNFKDVIAIVKSRLKLGKASLGALDVPYVAGVFPHRAIAGEFANAGHI